MLCLAARLALFVLFAVSFSLALFHILTHIHTYSHIFTYSHILTHILNLILYDLSVSLTLFLSRQLHLSRSHSPNIHPYCTVTNCRIQWHFRGSPRRCDDHASRCASYPASQGSILGAHIWGTQPHSTSALNSSLVVHTNGDFSYILNPLWYFVLLHLFWYSCFLILGTPCSSLSQFLFAHTIFIAA